MVTLSYLNLLVKPIILFRFPAKNIILCILKGEMSFKMHKIIYFFEKKKGAYHTMYLQFADLLPESHFFLFGLNTKRGCQQHTIFTVLYLAIFYILI